MRSGLVIFCWGFQRRYPVWAIHDNVTILTAFKTSKVRAISCYVSLFQALKKVILIIGHHADCRQWNNCGSQLLCSIKLLNFGYCITECLRPFLIDVSSQTMGIYKPLMNILMVAASFIKFYLLASILNQWMCAARDSFSHCWISMKQEV